MSEKPDIKAIIFDYGGVLSQEGYLDSFGDMYADKFNKDPHELKRFVLREWLAVRENQEPSTNFWKHVAAYVGTSPDVFREDLLIYSGFRYDVFSLAKQLKKNGYILAILSNQIEDWLEEVRTEKDFDKVFKVFSTSYNTQSAKPDTKIFLKTLEALGVPSHQCVFIDDQEKNLRPAKQLGMKTILFKSCDSLQLELTQLGISVKK